MRTIYLKSAASLGYNAVKTEVCKNGLISSCLLLPFYLEAKVVLLSYKRKTESQEFKVFINFMKIDFRSFSSVSLSFLEI